MGSNGTLIGRRTELEAIEELLGRAREGRSGVLVLRGAPGAGKTALLDRCADAADGFRVLRADGIEAEAELAFAGLHQLLRPLTGLLGGLAAAQRAALEAAFGVAPDAAGDRFLAAAAALEVLAEAAEIEPVLCLVDDVQWVDGPSLDALVFAARRLEAEPVAIVVALRDTEPVPPGLARFPTIELGGLTRDDARALLESTAHLTPADRDRVLDAAEGNPLALLELPRGPLGAGPAAAASMGVVERALADRVAALPDRTRTAVLLAAADDDPGAATALAALPAAGLDVGHLRAAEAEGLLSVDGARLAFRHPLVRSAAYGLAPFEERRRAHAALAAALSGHADADRRAWHRAAAAAGPDAEVADELAASAERARARGGHAAAAAALERAARLTADEPLRARRLVAAAEAARLAGDVDHAIALAGEGLAGAGDEETAAEAAAVRGAIRARRSDPEDAEHDLWNAARALAPRQPRRALRVAILAGEAAALAGRHERAAENAGWAAALPVGDADADRALVAFAAGLADLFAGRTAEAHPHLSRALELAERAGDPQVLVLAAIGGVYGGDVVAGRRGVAHAVAAARERGAVGQVANALQYLGHLEMQEGRIAGARTDATEGLALAQASGEAGVAAHCRGVLAWAAAARGEEDECRALAGEALEWAAAHTVRPAAEAAQRGLALLDLGLGRHDAAYDRLAPMVSGPHVHPGRRLLVAGDLAEAAAACERPDDARPVVDELAAWTRATGSAWGEAVHAGAEVQLAPDAAAAEEAFARAARAHVAIDLPFDRARLELRLGEQLRRARRRSDARGHLRTAADAFAHIGATPWAERAAGELRATGETARRRDPSTLDELTPQERQVARLVAEGTSNRDIAARLFLSPRTVEYHLGKVFRKLGLSSRTQLAALDW